MAIVVAVIVLPFYLWLDAALLMQIVPLLVILPFFLVMNFLILFGPLLIMNLSQIQGFEPGDAEWGVKLADVRGQAEAKEEVRRVVSIWQSGEAFERAGGKRERGLLFLGAPGTGKTMLAKAQRAVPCGPPPPSQDYISLIPRAVISASARSAATRCRITPPAKAGRSMRPNAGSDQSSTTIRSGSPMLLSDDG